MHFKPFLSFYGQKLGRCKLSEATGLNFSSRTARPFWWSANVHGRKRLDQFNCFRRKPRKLLLTFTSHVRCCFQHRKCLSSSSVTSLRKFFFACIYYNCSCWGKCGRWRVMSLTLLSRWDMKCCVFMQFNCLFEAEDYQNPIYLYLNLLAFFPPESYYVVDQKFLLS